MLRILHRLRPGHFYPCAAVVIAAVILGGGTREGFLSDVLLQLIAIPLLVVSMARLPDLSSLGAAKLGVAFCGAVILVPILQLIPLPPGVWTALPNRQVEAEALTLANQPLPWMPISVSPRATWLSALSLLVPVSVFLGVILLDYNERSALSLTLLGAALLSVFLGLSQVAQGPSSPLRFFDFSNTTDAIGFFANRNHLAALLYVTLLLAGAWTIAAATAAESSRKGRMFDTSSIMALLASFTVMVALLAGQAMARSRAGLGLTIIALFGTIALAFADRRRSSRINTARIIAVSIAVAAMFTTQFGLYRIMERFTYDPLADSRIAFAHTTIAAAKDFMPFGSGLGTFIPVYAMSEKREDVLANHYVNRAHDDVLELWLEAGAFGVGLLAAFVSWFALRAIAIWRQPKSGEARDIDRSLARAATVGVGLMMAHCTIDYPLRTGAMAAVFALACAFMFEPVGIRRTPARAPGNAKRGFAIPEPLPPMMAPDSSAVRTASSPTGAFSNASPGATLIAVPRDELGKDVEWPEDWRKHSPKSR